ncbi:GHKL domain-containing protein [Balneolaceae bacterium YR4-1]|uniref:histidine kinase n=1 Tax=Halalkalibaculum roseum TaxID=2709311 RepID=A0A6M1T5N4_9BACT|nr:two-component regulator propeller domain-containing protein [Halalkalibaculum roseum]NGP75613.1 GHKL domain-containing protein [Halalkalibaculum roseum]
MNVKKISAFLVLAVYFFCFVPDNSKAQHGSQEVDNAILLLGKDSEIPALGPVEITPINAPGTTITEDIHGFMWFGGNNGLYRYDGSDFIHYQHDPLDSTSLSETWVESLYADSDGYLWIGTFGGGLNKLDPVTDTFTHFTHDAENPTSLSQDTVTVMLEDSRGTLWIGTHGGLNRFDKSTGEFTRYLHESNDTTSLSNNQVRALYEDSRGTLWVGTGSPAPTETPVGEGGLNRFHPESQTFTRYLHDPADSTSLINNKVMSIYEDSRGTFWVGTLGDGLHSMNRASGTFTRHWFDSTDQTKVSRPFLDSDSELSSDCVGFPCGGVTFIHEDKNGMMWVGGLYGGLNRYNLKTGAMSHHDANNSGFVYNQVWSIHESHDGTLWVGTWSGAYKVNAPVNLFPQFLLGNDDFISILGMNNSVSTIQEDLDHRLWVSYYDFGLVRIDRRTGIFTHFQSQESNPDSLVSNYINSTAIDPNGNVWISHFSGGISKYNNAENNFRRLFSDDENLNTSTEIIIDRKGQLWVGTLGPGLYHIDSESQSIINHYGNNVNDPNSLVDTRITTIYESNIGSIWVGTMGGLNVIERSLKNQSNQPTIRSFLQGLQINTILEDENSKIWVGTRANGLIHLDPSTGRWVNYTSENGLPTNTVVSLIFDDFGFIWIATVEGQSNNPSDGKLTRFNPNTGEVTNFTSQEGLPEIGFYYSALKTHDGLLFFGGIGGFTFFDPSMIQDPTFTSPKIALTGLQLSNEAITPTTSGVLNRPIYMEDQIELTHRQNEVTFDYKAFAYRNFNQIEYQYQLEPYDSDWVNARTQQSARYSRVPPGEYRFRVRTIDDRGRVSPEEAALGVTILPPWWRTWWAYGLYALIFAAGVFSVDRFQRNRLIAKERERARDRELEQEKKHSHQLEQAYSKLEDSLQKLTAAQDQLVQQEKLASLGQLTAGIAHEIKTPLNFVNNFSDLSVDLIEEARLELKNENGNADSVKDTLAILDDVETNLRKIHEHGSRADGIVKSMLEHSRGGDGKMEPTPVNPLIKEYVNLAYHGMCAGKNPIDVDIQLDMDDSVGEVEMNAEDFSRVIVNLCNNAFDAMREKILDKHSESTDSYKPRLTVRTQNTGREVAISIEDNGPGIPEEVKDKIMQPFFTTKKGTAGTGLGLSITNDIIKAHGGSLDVESEPGKTVFTITLSR